MGYDLVPMRGPRRRRAKVLEKEFRQQVVELAIVLGWRAYWTWNSIHSPAGYPDLCLCRPPRLVYIELKVGPRQLTWEQRQWMEALLQVPCVEAYVMRPDDWERLIEILR